MPIKRLNARDAAAKVAVYDAHSPTVAAPKVLTSLTLYVVAYTVIFVGRRPRR